MRLVIHVLFEHWEAAALAAERAWLDVWRKIDARARGTGPALGAAEIADAYLLRCAADELLEALRRQLSEELERVQLHCQEQKNHRSTAPRAIRSCKR